MVRWSGTTTGPRSISGSPDTTKVRPNMPLVLGDVKLGGGIQPSRNMSHNTYGCWDAYISMVFLRREAVALWERIESLHDRIEENPGHKNNGVARERIAAMEHQVIELQDRFVLHEQSANAYWKEMTVKVRTRKESSTCSTSSRPPPISLGAGTVTWETIQGLPRGSRSIPSSYSSPHHPWPRHTQGGIGEQH
jgi:hypothetical protein